MTLKVVFRDPGMNNQERSQQSFSWHNHAYVSRVGMSMIDGLPVLAPEVASCVAGWKRISELYDVTAAATPVIAATALANTVRYSHTIIIIIIMLYVHTLHV